MRRVTSPARRLHSRDALAHLSDCIVRHKNWHVGEQVWPSAEKLFSERRITGLTFQRLVQRYSIERDTKTCFVAAVRNSLNGWNGHGEVLGSFESLVGPLIRNGGGLKEGPVAIASPQANASELGWLPTSQGSRSPRFQSAKNTYLPSAAISSATRTRTTRPPTPIPHIPQPIMFIIPNSRAKPQVSRSFGQTKSSRLPVMGLPNGTQSQPPGCSNRTARSPMSDTAIRV